MTALATEKPKRKSTVGHFRVWKDVYESLEQEAVKREVSLNTLVNQLLSAHVRDDVVWEEMGYVKLTKNSYRVLLNHISSDKLDELGPALARNTPRAMMLARTGKVDLEAVLDYLRFRSRSGWFSMDESNRNGSVTICFMHDLGQRESAVLRSYFVTLFGLAGIHPQVITTDSSVVVEY